MFRAVFGLALAMFAVSATVQSAAAGDAKTIRIQPREVYGATISIEAGVRVFRPLPRTTHVIVNPNKTPVNITVKDITKNVYKTVRYNAAGHVVSRSGYASAGYIPFRPNLGRGVKHRRFRGRVRRGGRARHGGSRGW